MGNSRPSSRGFMCAVCIGALGARLEASLPISEEAAFSTLAEMLSDFFVFRVVFHTPMRRGDPFPDRAVLKCLGTQSLHFSCPPQNKGLQNHRLSLKTFILLEVLLETSLHLPNS